MVKKRYTKYAERINTLAKQRYADYKKAVDAFEEAEKKYRFAPSGWATADYQKKKIQAEADYRIAKQELQEARNIYQKTMDEVVAIRNELFAEVSEDWSMKPNDLDRNTVDLLQSGICTPEEIADLFNKAETITTKRYVAKFASEEVKRLPMSMERTKAIKAQTLLNHVAHTGQLYKDVNNAEPIMRFDAVSEVLRRGIRNPKLMENWDAYTEENLAEM